MPRVKRGTKRNDRRKKILKRASGYFLTKSKLYQAAQEAVERGLKFAYIGRKQKKRQFRSLWIVRIGAAAKLNGISYSQLIHGLKVAGIERPWDPDRQRAIGAGGEFGLTTVDQVLLAAVWLRQYPTQEALGFLFGVSDSTALRAVLSRWVARIAPAERAAA